MQTVIGLSLQEYAALSPEQRAAEDRRTRAFAPPLVIQAKAITSAPPPAKPAPAPVRATTPEAPMPVHKPLTLEQRCELKWNADPALRTEFGTAGGLAAYLAHERAVAAGSVQVLGAPRSGTTTAAPGLSIEETAKVRWQATPAIRQEFRLFERYIGFLKAQAAGAVRMHGGGVR